MTEARWGDDARDPPIDWTMSAALENVVRGGGDIAEVTNLGEAVRTWRALNPDHQAHAVLLLDHPVHIDGAALNRFGGEGIAALAERIAD